LPKFHYVVKDASGKTIEADCESYDQKGLILDLQKQGYFVLKLEEIIPSITLKTRSTKTNATPRKFAYNGIKLQDYIAFARQLTTMLEAGVSLLRSLEVINDQIQSKKFYDVAKQVSRDVEQGSSLSDALAKHPRVFNQFWVSLVEVGESSGTLPMVLAKLSFYLEQEASFNSTITSALMYPMILFFICMGAVVFFALVVGPRFETVFNSMGVQLPLITKVLLITFRFIKDKFFLIIAAAILGMFLFKKWSKTKSGRIQIEHFCYGLPTFGNIYKLIIIEKFTSQMAILVDSGVPILHALDISERLVDNYTCAQVIAGVKESVRQGELLVSPMERSKFFPSMCTQMITVGEETGELSKMLKHVAHFYLETVETFMKRLGTIIEPFMLVFMGAVIGVIVLAMFLPLFNIAQLGGSK